MHIYCNIMSMYYNAYSENHNNYSFYISNGRRMIMSVRTIDVAYDYLKAQKHSVSFRDLWQVVKAQLGFTDAQAQKKISQFYTDLTLDGRFTSLENNVWDLKSNHKFDEVFIDTANLLDEDPEDEEETEQDSDELDLETDDSKEDY